MVRFVIGFVILFWKFIGRNIMIVEYIEMMGYKC